jgi:hypothetical protein
LLRKVVEYSHAKSVLDADRAKQKGRSRKVTDAVVSLEEQLAKQMGNDKYVVPSSVKDQLKEKLDALPDDKFDEMVSSVVEQYGSLDSEYDSDDVEDAQTVLDDLKENLDGENNVDSVSAQIAHALQAQRVLERHEQRKKESDKASKGALKGVAKAFGMNKLPKDVGDKLSTALEGMSLEDKQKFSKRSSMPKVSLKGRLRKPKRQDVYPSEADLPVGGSTYQGLLRWQAFRSGTGCRSGHGCPNPGGRPVQPR